MAKVKVGVWDVDEETLEQQHQAARRRGKRQVATEPQAQRAGYDQLTGQLWVELSNGVTFLAPIILLQDLADATPEDLARVTLGPRGASLHWEKLGVDFSLVGLLAGLFGTRAWMAELGRRGGRAASASKAAAARANGRKGGRPAKTAHQTSV